MKNIIVLAVLAIGLCADGLAAERKDYPPISLVLPGASSSKVDRDQFVVLVVEGTFISHDKSPVSNDGVLSYVNTVLKNQGASYLGVHIREGVKYGDVVRTLDILRQTSAKSIGVSMVELPIGREL